MQPSHAIFPGTTPPLRKIILQMHTPAHKSVLDSAKSRMDSECASGCTWSTARATAPSLGQPTPGVVKQDKSSGGSVDTTKTRSGPQRVRMSSGERPIGAAKGRKSDTEALCQPPPLPCAMGSVAKGAMRDPCSRAMQYSQGQPPLLKHITTHGSPRTCPAGAWPVWTTKDLPRAQSARSRAAPQGTNAARRGPSHPHGHTGHANNSSEKGVIGQ